MDTILQLFKVSGKQEPRLSVNVICLHFCYSLITFLYATVLATFLLLRYFFIFFLLKYSLWSKAARVSNVMRFMYLLDSPMLFSEAKLVCVTVEIFQTTLIGKVVD